MRKIDDVIEYAIPNNEIIFDYLKKVEKITTCIEYEEYIDEDYRDGLEVVYDIKSSILRRKI